MSGRKRTTVSIDEDAYRDLQRRAEQLRVVQSNLPEVLASVRAESAADLQRRLAPLEQRQREYQQALGQVSAEIRQVEARTAQRLEQQQRTMRAELDATATQLRSETQARLAQQQREFQSALRATEGRLSDRIEEQGQRLQAAIDAERDARRQHVKQVQQQLTSLIEQERTERQQEIRRINTEMESQSHRIGSLEAAAQGQQQRAQEWINAAQVMRDFVDSKYRHQQFAPGQLAKIERALDQAKANARSDPQAALVGAQNACNQLSDLRLELERLEAEWQMWRTASLEAAREVLELAERNRKVKPVDLKGQEINEQGLVLEVDWWTEGKLSALVQEMEKLVSRINDDKHPMSIDELREAAQKVAPEIRGHLDDLVVQAQVAALASQLRVNIADLVVQALESRGFSYQDGTYEGEDWRGGYAAKVTGIDGAEVTVQVMPSKDNPVQSQVIINTYYEDEAVMGHEQTQRAQAVVAALQEQAGLATGGIERTASEGDPGWQDIEAVRRRARAAAAPAPARGQ